MHVKIDTAALISVKHCVLGSDTKPAEIKKVFIQPRGALAQNHSLAVVKYTIYF